MIRCNLLSFDDYLRLSSSIMSSVPGMPIISNRHPVSLSERLIPAASPAIRVVQGTVGNARSESVIAYLGEAELQALNPWDKDDLRVATLTVLRCAEIQDFPTLVENAALQGKRVGEMLWEYSFWMYYGLTHEKAMARWAARDREREALFARLALPAKKPVQSVRFPADGKKVG